MIRATTVSLGIIAVALGVAVASSSRKDGPKTAKSQDNAKAAKANDTPRVVEGTILDPLGKPAAGATVVVGFDPPQKPNHEVLTTDEDGHFSWSITRFPKGAISYFVAASKEGLAPETRTGWMNHDERESRVKLKLDVAEPMSAVLVDQKGKPLVGARVDVEMSAHQGPQTPHPDGNTSSTMTSYGYVRRDVIAGSPLESLFQATTDRDGKFAWKASPGPWLKLNVNTAEGVRMRVVAEKKPDGVVAETGVEGFIAAWPKQPTRLIAVPTPRIAGRVTSKMPGVAVAGLKISTQGSNPAGRRPGNGSMGIHDAVTDNEGRFVIDGFDEGTVNVFVHGDGEAETWTYRAAQDVDLQNGQTAEVPIELIPGIMAEGTVLNEKGTPVAGAWVAVYGPFRPRSGAATKAFTTDPEGRFHFRLPPGETYFYVMNQGPDFIVLPNNGSSQTVTIPEGKDGFSIPAIEVTAAVALHGKIIDAKGEPVPQVTIVGVVSERLRISPGVTPTPAGVSDLLGEFRLAVQNHAAPPGKRAVILVRLPDNREFQLAVTPTLDGTVILKLPEK